MCYTSYPWCLWSIESFNALISREVIIFWNYVGITRIFSHREIQTTEENGTKSQWLWHWSRMRSCFLLCVSAKVRILQFWSERDLHEWQQIGILANRSSHSCCGFDIFLDSPLESVKADDIKLVMSGTKGTKTQTWINIQSWRWSTSNLRYAGVKHPIFQDQSVRLTFRIQRKSFNDTLFSHFRNVTQSTHGDAFPFTKLVKVNRFWNSADLNNWGTRRLAFQDLEFLYISTIRWKVKRPGARKREKTTSLVHKWRITKYQHILVKGAMFLGVSFQTCLGKLRKFPWQRLFCIKWRWISLNLEDSMDVCTTLALSSGQEIFLFYFHWVVSVMLGSQENIVTNSWLGRQLVSSIPCLEIRWTDLCVLPAATAFLSPEALHVFVTRFELNFLTHPGKASQNCQNKVNTPEWDYTPGLAWASLLLFFIIFIEAETTSLKGQGYNCKFPCNRRCSIKGRNWETTELFHFMHEISELLSKESRKCWMTLKSENLCYLLRNKFWCFVLHWEGDISLLNL